MIGQYTKLVRKHKSLKLTPSEIKLFEKYVKQFPSQEVAAESLGIKSRNTIGNILKGSGSSEYINLIRQKIGTANQLA